MRSSLLLPALFGLLIPLAVRAGVVHPRFAWPGGQVPVCWGEARDMQAISNSVINFSQVGDAAVHVVPPEVRDHFRRFAETQVSPQETGVTLAGWESCGPRDAESVKIVFSRPSALHPRGLPGMLLKGISSLGYRSSYDGHDLRPMRGPGQHYLIMAYRGGDASDLRTLEFTFLHELGHVFGLRHGHIQSRTTRYREAAGPGALITSAHDPYSIMDYDFLMPLLEGAQPADGRLHFPMLSSGDQHALRCLYTYDRAQRRRLCRAQERPWEED